MRFYTCCCMGSELAPLATFIEKKEKKGFGEWSRREREKERKKKISFSLFLFSCPILVLSFFGFFLLPLLALAKLLAQPLLLRLGELGAILIPRRRGDGGGGGSGRSRRSRGRRRSCSDGARLRSGGRGAPVGIRPGARRRPRGAEELGRDLAVDGPLGRGSPSSPSPSPAAAAAVAPSASAAAGGAVVVASAAAGGVSVRVVAGRRCGGRGGGDHARLQPRDVSVLVGEVEVLRFVFVSRRW